MGNNFSSIKVDKERRVWVRQRQQRPSDLRDNNPYPPYGTVYQEALPVSSPGRPGQSSSTEGLLPFYVPVAADRHPLAASPGGHAHQSTTPQLTNSTNSMPMPSSTMAGQQAPVGQGSPQQGFMQSGPMQQGPIQSEPIQTALPQPGLMQSAPMLSSPMQPGPAPPGVMPPGPMPSIPMPPGLVPPNLMQSGPVPQGPMQPVPMQPGPMQPGPMQQGPN